MPWDERIQIINEQFPSTVHLDWCRAFEDVELFGRILRDILKVDQTPPGRSGPRPVLDRDAATRRLRQFMRSDYSSLSFQETFQLLAGDRSHRALAAKIGIDRNMVQKLLAGSREPDIPLMEMIARAFKKDPSYFVEYRTAYVLGALGDKMQSAPETTIDLYKKLKPRS
jgi:transcriptional regulator with XRE-family HTH domain